MNNQSEREDQPTHISGIYSSTVVAGNGHIVGGTAMSNEDIKDRLRAEYLSGNVNIVDLKAMERALDKAEYRSEYNRRPDVKARRKQYNKQRLQEEKVGRQLLAQLLRQKQEQE